mmetsp:Transcript_23211/g.72510  ORF Transcript_23211/g.72510 Transcript_23211/m.72510 type:complete len:276 (+) Transcript_23211:372-1199(+)
MHLRQLFHALRHLRHHLLEPILPGVARRWQRLPRARRRGREPFPGDGLHAAQAAPHGAMVRGAHGALHGGQRHLLDAHNLLKEREGLLLHGERLEQMREVEENEPELGVLAPEHFLHHVRARLEVRPRLLGLALLHEHAAERVEHARKQRVHRGLGGLVVGLLRPEHLLVDLLGAHGVLLRREQVLVSRRRGLARRTPDPHVAHGPVVEGDRELWMECSHHPLGVVDVHVDEVLGLLEVLLHAFVEVGGGQVGHAVGDVGVVGPEVALERGEGDL